MRTRARNIRFFNKDSETVQLVDVQEVQWLGPLEIYYSGHIRGIKFVVRFVLEERLRRPVLYEARNMVGCSTGFLRDSLRALICNSLNSLKKLWNRISSYLRTAVTDFGTAGTNVGGMTEQDTFSDEKEDDRIA